MVNRKEKAKNVRFDYINEILKTDIRWGGGHMKHCLDLRDMRIASMQE